MYRDGDQWVVRASSITRCQQSLIAAAVGMEPLPPPETLQRAFDEGSAGEDEVLRMFCEGGWHGKSRATRAEGDAWKLLDPTELGSYHQGGVSYPHVKLDLLDDDQFTMQIPVGKGAVIRGHLDGIAQRIAVGAGGEVLEMGERAVVEAKLLGPDLFAKVTRGGLIKGFGAYAWQVSLYMAATGLPGWFVAGEKKRWKEGDERCRDVDEHLRYDIASVYVERFETPPIALGRIKARVVKLVKAAEAVEAGGGMPACDVNQYPCEYVYLHDGTEVEIADKPEPVVVEDAELAQQVADLAAEYHAASASERDAKKTKDACKEGLKALLAVDASGPSSPGGWQAGEWQVGWVHEEVPAATVTRAAYTKSYPKISKKKVGDQ